MNELLKKIQENTNSHVKCVELEHFFVDRFNYLVEVDIIHK